VNVLFSQVHIRDVHAVARVDADGPSAAGGEPGRVSAVVQVEVELRGEAAGAGGGTEDEHTVRGRPIARALCCGSTSALSRLGRR